MPSSEFLPSCSVCGVALLESSGGVCGSCSSARNVETADFGEGAAVPVRAPQRSAGTASKCMRCGATLAVGASSNGWCDRCLSSIADAAFAPPPPKPAPIPPVEIPGYRMIRYLGGGGMGVVWLAEQTATKQTVAIKFCREDRFAIEPDSRALQRFEREMELAARLNHPHIARVFGGGEVGSVPYCVMEFVAGCSLAEHVVEKKLDRKAIVALLAQVAEAAQHAHQNGIIHRDLKPSNILVDQRGRPKILDFGLAKALERTDGTAPDLSQSGAIVGTLRYMAPEQAGGRTVDTRTDVYALGVILYELLIGQNPHDLSGHFHAVLQRIATEEPHPPRRLCRDLDAEMEMLLLKALGQFPEERYRTAGDLADELSRWLRHEPLTAGTATAFYYVRKWLRRHRTVATAAAILLSVSVWAVSSYVVNIRQARDKADAAAAKEKLANAESRRLYAESLAQNAELAIQRGDWKLALEQINAAIQEKHPAVTDLRVRRLDVFDSLNQPSVRNEEVQALNLLDLSPVNRARLALRQGESLCYDGHAEEGMKRIQAAIQTGHLPEHEDAYGRGLTAETSTDALTYFRKALQLSPYTYRYHQMMWLILATCGYLDEEGRQLDASAVLFPHDGNLIKVRALLEAHRGHDETARQLLESLGPALSDTARNQVQAWCEIEWSFRYYLVDRWDGMEPDLPAQKYPMVQLKLIFLTQSPFAMAATNMGMQMPSYLERSLGNFSKALVKWKVGDLQGALRLLEENEASHREATGYFIKGLILSTGRPAGTPGDPESDSDYRQRMVQSVEAFTEASRLPSIYAGIPEQALVGAVFPELHLWNRKGIPSGEKHELLQRIVSRYKQASQATRLRPFHASLAAQLALKLDDYDFARKAAALLPEDQPKRYETFIAIEQQAGNVKEALRIGDEAMRRFPDHEAFQTLRQKIAEDLPKLIDDLQKSLERSPSK